MLRVRTKPKQDQGDDQFNQSKVSLLPKMHFSLEHMTFEGLAHINVLVAERGYCLRNQIRAGSSTHKLTAIRLLTPVESHQGIIANNEIMIGPVQRQGPLGCYGVGLAI